MATKKKGALKRSSVQPTYASGLERAGAKKVARKTGKALKSSGLVNRFPSVRILGPSTKPKHLSVEQIVRLAKAMKA